MYTKDLGHQPGVKWTKEDIMGHTYTHFKTTISSIEQSLTEAITQDKYMSPMF